MSQRLDRRRGFAAGLSVVVVCASAVFGAPSVASAQDQGSWSTASPMPTARAEIGVAALDGKIYVVGGTAQGRWDSPLNYEYDPATDHWRERAPLPRGLSHVGLVGLNGKLYAFGGFTNIVHVGAMNLAYVYDPAADSWQPIAPLSSPRASVGVAAVDGKIHAIGGRGLDKVTVNIHEVYDPATDRWSKAAPLPLARDHLGIAVIDGKIHVVGGRTANQTDNVSEHDVYDPSTDQWTQAAPMPTARSSGAATYYSGLLLYFGGECAKLDPTSKLGGGDTFDTSEAYDPKSDRWLTMARLPAARHAYGAATVGSAAYFPGGTLRCGGMPITDQLLVFRLK
jgi:N-acetylneuraminic acid mutarotase